MKFLCYGTNGWIGTQMKPLLLKHGHEFIEGKSRCDDYDELVIEIDSVKPDTIFSSIGRTHGTDKKTGQVYTTIDFLELPGNFSVNVRDNLVSPLNLARACKERGLKCNYMGTGCIFEYDEEHKRPVEENATMEKIKGFAEEDKPNFIKSGYSTVKGWTDMEMQKYKDTVLNWRIRMPISNENNSRDFITKITTYAKVCSIANSMTVLPQILPIMIDMMERGETGTYNMCNPGLITHNQILTMYQQFVNPTFKIVNFSLEEQAQILKAGRSNNYLDTTKLETYCKKHNLVLDSIKDAVADVLVERGAKNAFVDMMNPNKTRAVQNKANRVDYHQVCQDCKTKDAANCCEKCRKLLQKIETRGCASLMFC